MDINSVAATKMFLSGGWVKSKVESSGRLKSRESLYHIPFSISYCVGHFLSLRPTNGPIKDPHWEAEGGDLPSIKQVLNCPLCCCSVFSPIICLKCGADFHYTAAFLAFLPGSAGLQLQRPEWGVPRNMRMERMSLGTVGWACQGCQNVLSSKGHQAFTLRHKVVPLVMLCGGTNSYSS